MVSLYTAHTFGCQMNVITPSQHRTICSLHSVSFQSGFRTILTVPVIQQIISGMEEEVTKLKKMQERDNHKEPTAIERN